MLRKILMSIKEGTILEKINERISIYYVTNKNARKLIKQNNVYNKMAKKYAAIWKREFRQMNLQ